MARARKEREMVDDSGAYAKDKGDQGIVSYPALEDNPNKPKDWLTGEVYEAEGRDAPAGTEEPGPFFRPDDTVNEAKVDKG